MMALNIPTIPEVTATEGEFQDLVEATIEERDLRSRNPCERRKGFR
jgi:hypothetical protein